MLLNLATFLTRGGGGGGGAAPFDPSTDLNLNLWFEMTGTGTLQGSNTGTYIGDLSDEDAINAALTGSTFFFAQWDDASPSGFDITASSTSSRPSWLGAGVGANDLILPSMNPDDTNDGLRRTEVYGIRGGGSMALVIDVDTLASHQKIFTTLLNSNEIFCVDIDPGTTALRIGGKTGGVTLTAASVAPLTLGPHVIVFTVASNIVSARIDGVTMVGTTNPDLGFTKFPGKTVVGNTPSLAASFLGQVGAVLGSADVWGASLISQVEAYLNNKYIA